MLSLGRSRILKKEGGGTDGVVPHHIYFIIHITYFPPIKKKLIALLTIQGPRAILFSARLKQDQR